MNKIGVSFLIILTIGISSCRVKKVVHNPNSDKTEISEELRMKSDIIPQLKLANFNFEYLTSKAKVKVSRGDKDYSLTFNMRLQKDEQIWISVNAIGGIEVARVLLNKDSVRILDRLNKQYMVKDYVFLSELLKTNVDFFLIQDLILGNSPVNFDYTNSNLTEDVNTYQFAGNQELIYFEVGVRKEDYKLKGLKVNDVENPDMKVSVNYDGFKLIDGSNFPFLITSFASSQKESLTLNLEYVKVEKVNSLEFPFNVPKKFE